MTLRQFVGALLQQIARARAVSDAASASLAELYLQHELLKGFPVPRMNIGNLDLELNFAVATPGGRLADDPELRKNFLYQALDWIGTLPEDAQFAAYFGKDAQLAARWRGGRADVSPRLDVVLMTPTVDLDEIIRRLSLVVRNVFYEMAPDDRKPEVFTLLGRQVARLNPGEPATMAEIVEQRLRDIITPAAGGAPASSSDDSLEIDVLIGASQLEKLDPALLQRIRITVSPSDRRWVLTQENGKPVHILDRA